MKNIHGKFGRTWKSFLIWLDIRNFVIFCVSGITKVKKGLCKKRNLRNVVIYFRKENSFKLSFGETWKFAQAVDRNSDGFLYLKEQFPRISDAKIMTRMFVGLQIRELVKDKTFEQKLNLLKKLPGTLSKMLLKLFENFQAEIETCELLDLYKAYVTLNLFTE